jgi:glutamyl-tRNA synthetase
MKKSVRVRIAPSPTGDPHVGLAYVTLFNLAFAKKNGGKLILRLEDTDQARAKAGSDKMIFEGLKWLGLTWDEGPDIGGPFGPYRQSERKDIHLEYAQKLLEKQKAYRCFCSAETLEQMRSEQKAKGERTKYDSRCYRLTPAEVEEKLKTGPYVIRFKSPTEGEAKFVDELRGEISIANEILDDTVLVKSDGHATYHLANVVDDHLMEITHVIRAEEWISSTPKHVNLYQAFGWEMPKFIHMPLLRNNDKTKISKRKNPVSLMYYKRRGILPQAMLNFLGLMGWSYGENQEFFSFDEMVEKFDFKHLHLGGPVFDIAKLVWMNKLYLSKLTEDQFLNYVKQSFFNDEYLRSLYPLVRERLDTVDEFFDRHGFFFNGPLVYNQSEILPHKVEVKTFESALKLLLEKLDEEYLWESLRIENHIKEVMEEFSLKPKDFLLPIRLICTGRKDSPPLMESLEVLGREMVRFRIREFLKIMSRS